MQYIKINLLEIYEKMKKKEKHCYWIKEYTTWSITLLDVDSR
jgi:hypothetical protein